MKVENQGNEASQLDEQNAEDQDVENVDQEETQEEASKPDLAVEIAGMKEGFNRLAETLKPREEAPKQMSPAEHQALWKTNPMLAMEIEIQNRVEKAVGGLRGDLTAEQKRTHFDQRAEKEFPQLITDKAFQKATIRAKEELMQQDGFTANSPTLIYRAAQVAALRTAGKSTQTSRGSTPNMSGEPVRSGASGGGRAPVSDAETDHLIKLFGIKDKDGSFRKAQLAKKARR